MIDVGGEHDAERQRAHQHERGQAVVAIALVAGEPADGRGHESRRRGRAEVGGEADPVGEDEAGERGRADRVREEGQAAQDDPRPDDARGDGEHGHLEHPALDERQGERVEHRGAMLQR